MSREIKFRVWDNEENKMFAACVVGGEVIVVTHEENKIGDFEATYFTTNNETAGFKVMQFTGLIDKNGKEVYEGDICRGSNGKYWVIEWIAHSWCMTNSSFPNGRMKFGGEETYTLDKWLELPPMKKTLELIGNIYQHPHLLNPPKQ